MLLAACVNQGLPKGTTAKDILSTLIAQWLAFETWLVKQVSNNSYKLGNGFNFANYYKGSTVSADLKKYSFKV